MPTRESRSRWERDVSPASWLAGQISDQGDRIGALVPGGYPALVRLLHTHEKAGPESLSLSQREALMQVLVNHTRTPHLSFSCVADRYAELDDQGVRERVVLPGVAGRFLLRAGPLELALLPPPEKSLHIDLPEVGTREQLAMALSRQVRAHSGGRVVVATSYSDQEIRLYAKALSARPGFLDEVAPTYLWPEDRAWFVAILRDFGASVVAGSAALAEQLMDTPGLGGRAVQREDLVVEIAQEMEERTYGPVIAAGNDAGQHWTLRGRISEDGAWSMINGHASGGGRLPFEDLGHKRLGHFGSFGYSSAMQLFTLKGVVSPQAASVELEMADGSIVPVRIIDVGDRRANFFVAVWSTSVDWQKLVARDGNGAELDAHERD
jgi:hypothetical protein